MILLLTKVDGEIYGHFWGDLGMASISVAISVINEEGTGPLCTDWKEFQEVSHGCMAFKVDGIYELDLALKVDIDE